MKLACRRRVLTCVVITLLPLGCMRHALQGTQLTLRDVMLTMHEQQILDNLVRVATGRPLLHLEYTQATASVKTTTSGNVGYTLVDPSSGGGNKAFNNNTFNIGASAQVQDTAQIAARPVLNNTNIYTAYHNFVNAKHLEKTADRPESNRVHASLLAEYDGKHYFVKKDAKSINAFQNLSLIAASTRVKIESKAVTRRVSMANEYIEIGEKGDWQYSIRLGLDRAIKNPSTTQKILVMLSPADSRQFFVHPNPDRKKGENTTSVLLIYSTKDKQLGHDISPENLRKKLVGKEITFSTLQFGELLMSENVVEDLGEAFLRFQLQELREK